MTEMLKRSNLKKNKKGFTLVEIIVVLVIIAILAAIAIPTMLGFVNEARQSEYIAEGRTALVASQTIVTREYALDPGISNDDMLTKVKAGYKAITGNASKVTDVTTATVVNGQITVFVCDVTSGSTVYEVTINTTNNTTSGTKKS